MLEGRTIIELEDVKTGEKERHEYKNMITNALKYIFSPIGQHKLDSAMFSGDNLPYYEKLLGGIMLFDGALEEDVDNVYAPADVEATACGVYGLQNDTTGTTRGDYNVTESEVNLDSKYVKYVYDFTTSQGNGTIASVCLTSKYGGYCGYGSSDPTLKNTGNCMSVYTGGGTIGATGFTNTGGRTTSISVGVTQYAFAIDPQNDIAYYFRINSAKSISIIKRKFYCKSVSIFDTPTSNAELIETVDLTEFSTSMASSSCFSYIFNLDEGYLYIISAASSSIQQGSAITVHRITFSTWAVTEYSLTNQTGETIYIGGSNSHYYSIVYGGHLYVWGTTNWTAVYKINLENSADVVKITIPSGGRSSYNMPQFARNGRIYYGTYSHNYMGSSERIIVINTEKETALLTEMRYLFSFSSQVTPIAVIGDPMCICTGSGFYYPGNYLATINNLDSPVTKTADKTMKVTYIIQDHED